MSDAELTRHLVAVLVGINVGLWLVVLWTWLRDRRAR